MKSKNLFTLLLFLMAVGFSACNDKDGKEDEFEDVSLEHTELYALALNVTYEIPVTAGSGDYKAEVDDPSIADVSVKSKESGYALAVFTKKEGKTTVTVTDNKTGKSVTCSVSINVVLGEIMVTKIEYNVGAAQKETILGDMEKSEPYPVGSYYKINPFGSPLPVGAKGIWQVDGADGETITREEYAVAETGTLPLYLTELLPKHQVLWYNTFNIGERVRTYHLVGFLFPSSSVGNDAPSRGYIIIYEDLTEYYKTEYPEADVVSVVRSYIFNQWE